MTFGEKLREILKVGGMEPAVWNVLKPWLIGIARDRGCKSCFVKFVGFDTDFSKRISDYVYRDGLVECNTYKDNEKNEYAFFVWDGCDIKYDEINDIYYKEYNDVSDLWLEVTFNHAKEVVIVEKEIEFTNKIIFHKRPENK